MLPSFSRTETEKVYVLRSTFNQNEDSSLYNRRKISLLTAREAQLQRVSEKQAKQRKEALAALIPREWRTQKDIVKWLHSLELQHLALLFTYHKVDPTSMRQRSPDLREVPCIIHSPKIETNI